MMLKEELRKFGFIFFGYALFFILLMARFNLHAIPFIFWLLFLFFVVLSLFFPVLLSPIKRAWEGLFKILHWINLRILFGFLFIFIFYPIALYRRLRGVDILCLVLNKNLATYRSMINEYNNDLRRIY